MELTKYNHACALFTKGSAHLLIDPGIFTPELAIEDLPKIDVLIITHAHPDHFDKEKVSKIITANPEVAIFSTPEVASELTQAVIPEVGREYPAGGFTLLFYGGQHAVIHESIPVISNFGVSIDGQVYYPGDSFIPGPTGVKLLLCPGGAPWMKASEAIDFILGIKPQVVVPTHYAFFNEAGEGLMDNYIGKAAENGGSLYRRLSSGEKLTV